MRALSSSQITCCKPLLRTGLVRESQCYKQCFAMAWQTNGKKWSVRLNKWNKWIQYFQSTHCCGFKILKYVVVFSSLCHLSVHCYDYFQGWMIGGFFVLNFFWSLIVQYWDPSSLCCLCISPRVSLRVAEAAKLIM